MAICVDINNESHVPIAAIPYVTGGFLSLGNVADMIANYESFCDHRHSTVLSPRRIAPDGKLVHLDPRSFAPVAAALAQEGAPPGDWSTAGLVVREEDLRALMETLVTELTAAGNLDANRPPACWNPDAALPDSVSREINEHVRKPLNRAIGRKNSNESTRRRIRAAIAVIVERAARQGVRVDVCNMPGHKKDFVRLLRHVDPAIANAETTLDRHYFPALGLRWQRGARRQGAAGLLAAFGLAISPSE